MQWKDEKKKLLDLLDRADLGRLDLHKCELCLQLKNAVTKEIEVHRFCYISKDAENLTIERR